MKKVFNILGIIFAVIIVIIVIAAAIFIPRAIKLDREATAYIKDAVPKIVTNWKSQELVDRATPQLLASVTSRDMIDRMFVMFQRLGSLKNLETPKGTVVSYANTGTGAITVGNYKVLGEFENGKARIEIQVCRVGDTWKINGFKVYSDALLPTKA